MSIDDFLKADEEGMGFGSTYWPKMYRCPDCGRFMKRGLFSWVKHTTEDCPSFKKNKNASGILKYVDKNYPEYKTQKDICIKDMIDYGRTRYIAGIDPYKEQPHVQSFELRPHPIKPQFVLLETSKGKKARERKKKK